MGRRKQDKSRGEVDEADEISGPRSFIVKQGHVGGALTQLVHDMRKVMEPNTATRLKERASNRLKDYLVLAPALQVSHLLAFSLTDLAPSLRIARLPHGPTFSFRILRYSLMKDIINSSRHPKSSFQAYVSPPLLVLASFPTGPSAPAHLNLVLKCFQSLFPPLTPRTIALSTARRVALVSWNSETSTIDLRHYIITVRTTGVSRRVRRVVEGSSKPSVHKLPNLGKEKDIADFVLKQAGEDGYETGSTSAASDADPEEYAVRLAGDYVGRNNRKGDKRAVKLDEVGPRMELQLVKIVEGPPGKEGGVLYHEFVKKTAKEAARLKKTAAEKAKLRQQRREEQEKNVARKKADGQTGIGASHGDEDDLDEDADDDIEDEKWDDDVPMSDGEPQPSADESSERSESESDAPSPLKKRPRNDKTVRVDASKQAAKGVPAERIRVGR